MYYNRKEEEVWMRIVRREMSFYSMNMIYKYKVWLFVKVLKVWVDKKLLYGKMSLLERINRIFGYYLV